MMDPTPRRNASDWRTEVGRLLESPRDLVRSGALICSERIALTEFPAHRDLFTAYHHELLQTLEGALKWWEMMIFAEQQRGRDREVAAGVVDRRRPAGPASNPRIIR